MGAEGIDGFFNPSSIAVVGASREKGKVGHEVLKSLISRKFEGKIYPVNPKAREVLGLKAYPSITDIDGEVDMAVLIVPPLITVKVMEECARKGVKNVVIISGGFKEAGKAGEKAERRVVEIAREHGIRVIGPNCVGVFCPETRVDTLFQSDDRCLRPKRGDMAILSQSGTYALTLLEWMAEHGIGVSKFVSFGNKCDVDESDLIEYLGEDDKTRVILLYLESVKNGRKLLSTVRKVAPKKPVVIYKSGRSKEGVKAAKSHTGGLAGEYPVFKAAMKQAGAILVDSLSEMMDVAKLLAWQPLPRNNKIIMITNGAGPAVSAADMFSEAGIEIGVLKSETKEVLKQKLPKYCLVNEPVIDLTGSATSTEYREAIMGVLNEDIGIISVLFVFQDTPLDEGILDVMRETIEKARKIGKTVVSCAAGGPYTRKMVREIEKMRIPCYEEPSRMVMALSRVINYSKVRKEIIRWRH